MGATAAVGGALGVANAVGGMSRASAERRAQNNANKIQAESTRMSLLAQRQSLIDQATLESMSLGMQKTFAQQQNQLAQLDVQAQQMANNANIQSGALQGQMGINEGRFNNEVVLANANINETNARGQAAQQRFSAQEQEMQMNAAAQNKTGAVARQGTQAIEQGDKQLAQAQQQVDRSMLEQAAGGFSSSALANQRTDMTRQAFNAFGEVNQQANLGVDQAKQQQDYIAQVSGILKQMGISDADAIEAAGVAQAALAKAGYDLNNINLDAALGLLGNQTNIDQKVSDLQTTQQQGALALDKQAQDMSFALGETANKQQLTTGLKGIEAQARGATWQNAQAPSLLSSATQVGTAAYNAYQTFKPNSLLSNRRA